MMKQHLSLQVTDNNGSSKRENILKTVGVDSREPYSNYNARFCANSCPCDIVMVVLEPRQLDIHSWRAMKTVK